MARSVEVQHLDFEAIERICRAVSSSDVSLPERMTWPENMPLVEYNAALQRLRENRLGLARKIHITLSLNDVMSAFKDADFHRGTRKRLTAAIAKAKALRRELEDLSSHRLIVHGINLTMNNALTNLGISERSSFADIVEEAKGLENLLEATRENMCVSDQQLSARGGDDAESTRQAEWFKSLAKIFSETFDREPGISKTSDGQIDGPFVRFVEAVHSELGIPMTRSAIDKAYRRSKRGTSAR